MQQGINTFTVIYMIVLLISQTVHAKSDFKRPINSDISKTITVHKPLPKLPTTKVKLKEFVVPAALAWGVAKRKGFEFYPEGATGRKDGSDVWGVSYYRDSRNRQQAAADTARYSAGILMQLGTLINDNFWDLTEAGVMNSYARFHLFANARLNSRWSVRSIEISGRHTIVRRPTNNTRSAHYVVEVEIRRGARNSGLATFKNIVLIGPENQDWRRAFD